MSEEILQRLVKKYGAGAYVSGSEIVNEKLEIVSFGPALDAITGGVPRGSVVRLTGKEKCGKTVSALSLARNAQLQHPSTVVAYLDIEGRIKPRDIKGIKGLDLNRFKVFRSFRDEKTDKIHTYTGEEFLTIGEEFLHEAPRSVVIVDSISQLLGKDELESDIEKQHRAPGAVMMARFCRRMTQIIGVNKCIVIGITHQIANTDANPKSPKIVESGGTKIKYATDVALHAKKVTPWVYKDVQVGQSVLWKTTSTAICPPGREGTSWIRYGTGIDEDLELVELGIGAGFLSKTSEKSAWITLDYLGDEDLNKDGKQRSYQGKEAVLLEFREHPDRKERLRAELNSIYGLDHESEES